MTDLVERLRLNASPSGEWGEYADQLQTEAADEIEKLRAVINDNVPKLITVARMPNQEHVADAHNRALAELLKVTK